MGVMDNLHVRLMFDLERRAKSINLSPQLEKRLKINKIAKFGIFLT